MNVVNRRAMAQSVRCLLLSALIFVGLSPAALLAQTPSEEAKIDSALKSAGSGKQRVIITVRPEGRVSLLQALQAHGDAIKREHRVVNAVTAEVHGEDVRRLAQRATVTGISVDSPVAATGATVVKAPVPPGPTPWQASAVRTAVGIAPGAPAGSSVRVAVIDSGIAPLANLFGRIDGFYDFTQGGGAVAPYDDFGHGTFIASLIASSGADSNGLYQGLAPAARLVGFKVLDASGQGNTSDVVAALEFIVSERGNPASTLPRIDVINLSLGHPIFESAATDPLVAAVERAVAAGIVVVE
jgi:subtilisin family serine protease